MLPLVCIILSFFSINIMMSCIAFQLNMLDYRARESAWMLLIIRFLETWYERSLFWTCTPGSCSVSENLFCLYTECWICFPAKLQRAIIIPRQPIFMLRQQLQHCMIICEKMDTEHVQLCFSTSHNLHRSVMSPSLAITHRTASPIHRRWSRTMPVLCFRDRHWDEKETRKVQALIFCVKQLWPLSSAM